MAMLWALVFGLTTLVAIAAPAAARGSDPLPSWNDTASKRAITAFVGKVTTRGPGFVPIPERIAVFDNDGTLWPENPVPFQAAFAFDEIKRRAPYEPELAADPMVQALLKGDIVSGGGADFMRVWSERVYGIPPEQVVGSTAQARFEKRDGKPVLVKTMDHLFVDDKDGKPVGIQQFIGRRPIAVFGNSDGDQAMLEYGTIGNPRPSLGVIVRHTDAAREYRYDLNPKSSGSLDTALKAAPGNGWTVVDMAADWSQVFAAPH